MLRSPHFAKVYNGTCYLFVNHEQYWKRARDDCWNMGGEMLSLKDEKTMQFIRSVLNSRQLRWFKQGVWLGASYSRGRWRWTTGNLYLLSLIITMEICKAPTPRFKALNKRNITHNHDNVH